MSISLHRAVRQKLKFRDSPPPSLVPLELGIERAGQFLALRLGSKEDKIVTRRLLHPSASTLTAQAMRQATLLGMCGSRNFQPNCGPHWTKS
jgi:hypothetical protein